MVVAPRIRLNKVQNKPKQEEPAKSILSTVSSQEEDEEETSKAKKPKDKRKLLLEKENSPNRLTLANLLKIMTEMVYLP